MVVSGSVRLPCSLPRLVELELRLAVGVDCVDDADGSRRVGPTAGSRRSRRAHLRHSSTDSGVDDVSHRGHLRSVLVVGQGAVAEEG
jgi:hypothetical protein